MYSLKDISDQMGISRQAVKARFTSRKIQPAHKGSRGKAMYTLLQVLQAFKDDNTDNNTVYIDGHHLTLQEAKDHAHGMVRELQNQIDSGDMVPNVNLTRAISAYRQALLTSLARIFDGMESSNQITLKHPIGRKMDDFLWGQRYYMDIMIDILIMKSVSEVVPEELHAVADSVILDPKAVRTWALAKAAPSNKALRAWAGAS